MNYFIKKSDTSSSAILIRFEKFYLKRFETYGVSDSGLIVDHFNDARRGLFLGALIEGPDTHGHLYTRHSFI
jgi:hypothetical protein